MLRSLLATDTTTYRSDALAGPIHITIRLMGEIQSASILCQVSRDLRDRLRGVVLRRGRRRPRGSYVPGREQDTPVSAPTSAFLMPLRTRGVRTAAPTAAPTTASTTAPTQPPADTVDRATHDTSAATSSRSLYHYPTRLSSTTNYTTAPLQHDLDSQCTLCVTTILSVSFCHWFPVRACGRRRST